MGGGEKRKISHPEACAYVCVRLCVYNTVSAAGFGLSNGL